MLAEGQIQIIRPDGTSLTLHHESTDPADRIDTPYPVKGFNPFDDIAKAQYSGDVPFGDGEYSGAEFSAAVDVPIRVRVDGGGFAGLHNKLWPLRAAFAPIGTAAAEAELHWMAGGTEYLMYGRPRGIPPEQNSGGYAVTWLNGKFRALDPSIWSAAEHVATTGLYLTGGGVGAPLGAPVAVQSVVVDGVLDVVNNGTKAAPLLLRIDGPVIEPRISVTGPDDITRTLSLETVLETGQWLEVNTAKRTVRLNGTVTRLSDHFGSWPLALPGTSTLTYRASAYNDQSQLTARNRDRH